MAHRIKMVVCTIHNPYAKQAAIYLFFSLSIVFKKWKKKRENRKERKNKKRKRAKICYFHYFENGDFKVQLLHCFLSQDIPNFWIKASFKYHFSQVD